MTTSIRKPISCLKEPFITVTIFLLPFGVRKKFKMDVIFLTFSLMKSGLRSRIFQWRSEVIKVNTSSLKHAESFETPILSLSIHVLQRFSSYKIHCKSSVDGFGGPGRIRESPTKVTRLENHNPLKESHSETRIAAFHI